MADRRTCRRQFRPRLFQLFRPRPLFGQGVAFLHLAQRGPGLVNLFRPRPFPHQFKPFLRAREPFRRHSYLSDVAAGVICGLGPLGYELALQAAIARLTPAT